MKRALSVMLCLILMVMSVNWTTVFSSASEVPSVICESRECVPGDTVTVDVNLINNPGIMYLEITPVYSSELGAPTVRNGSVISDLTMGKQYIWTADNDINANGTLVTLTFTVDESVAPGDYSVGFIFRSAYNYNEASVSFTVIPAIVSVKEKPVPVTGLELDKKAARVETGDETLTLIPIFYPDAATDKNLRWSSSDDSVAAVSGGVVRLLKKGVVTITAETEDGGYTASCIVTISCSHRMGTDYPSEASTCTKHGHAAYTVCGECGEVIDGSDAELPLAEHTGGEAACNKRAVCAACGAEYGDIDSKNHKNIEFRGEKPATAAEAGNINYYFCKDCGKCFSEENCTEEISKESTLIDKLAPEIIEGVGLKVGEGSAAELSFKSNAAFDDFIRVELNGKTLDENSYTVHEGSIVVKLNSEYVASLLAGEYTLGIISVSGTASAVFTVTPNKLSIIGDVNGDGRMDTKDIVRLMKKISGQDVTVTDADINGDGRVDAKDIVRLMKMIAAAD